MASTVPVSKVVERRRQAIADKVDLARVTSGPVGLPRTDVTIDIDCEHKDGAVYLWGATLTTGGDDTGEYMAFVDWDPDLDQAGETALAARFADWLTEQVACAEDAGQAAIYHYSPTEPAKLRRALKDDPRVGPLTDRMVDLLAVVRDHYDGVAGKSLKTVAGRFGATWRTPDATGTDTLDWVDAGPSERGPCYRSARNAPSLQRGRHTGSRRPALRTRRLAPPGTAHAPQASADYPRF